MLKTFFVHTHCMQCPGPLTTAAETIAATYALRCGIFSRNETDVHSHTPFEQ